MLEASVQWLRGEGQRLDKQSWTDGTNWRSRTGRGVPKLPQLVLVLVLATGVEQANLVGRKSFDKYKVCIHPTNCQSTVQG